MLHATSLVVMVEKFLVVDGLLSVRAEVPGADPA